MKKLSPLNISFLKGLMETEKLGSILLVFMLLMTFYISNSTPEAYREIQTHKFLGIITLPYFTTHFVILGLFFLATLETKRDVIRGESLIYPLIGALGGIAIPAIIFIVGSFIFEPDVLAGWAIGTATDIAVVVGLIALIGKNYIPDVLRFLMFTLSIFDDIGAALIAIVFYGQGDIDVAILMLAFIPLTIAFFLARKGSENGWLYLAIGLVLWFIMKKAGLHESFAAILIALFIPFKKDGEYMRKVVSLWAKIVAFVVMPIFIFANAGLDFSIIDWGNLHRDYIAIGITIALAYGKPIGISTPLWVLKKYFNIDITEGTYSFWKVIGISCFGGVGLTMALFIANIAFSSTPQYIQSAITGIYLGSALSIIQGTAILLISGRVKN